MVQPEPISEEPKASDITEKQCKREDCLKMKPLSEFHKGSNTDGLSSYCIECARKLSAESNRNRREKQKAKAEAKKVTPAKPSKEKYILNKNTPEPEKAKAIEEYKRKNILNFLKL